VALTEARAQAAGLTTEALLARARERALDASILDDEGAPFFFRAEISSGRLDAYNTVMMPSTLRNFAQDAEAGTPFQNSHNTRQLPIGRSLAGRYVGAQGNGVARVEAEFFTVTGLRMGDVDTDHLIRAMRSGIVRDVSVGFFGGRTVCSICGGDMLTDVACTHVPGLTYDTRDPQTGRPTGTKAVAMGHIEGAHLAEVSAVFRGATPGAAVLKAQREAEGGRLRPEAARLLEERWRIRLPQAHRAWAGGGPAPAAPAAAAAEPTRRWLPDEVFRAG
jgi:hypothetical protein